MDRKCKGCNMNEKGKCLVYALDSCDNAINYCEWDDEEQYFKEDE